ncbi:MAG: transporter substrate-binding domain-containing protein [Sneathiella sp.]|nr:transporter substrate-binding domain-containing protein [Sneathiella sp.]
MKIWRTRIFLIASLLVLAISARAEEIILSADPWCPYNCTPQSNKEGFQVEVAREALAFFDIDVTYKTLPYRRAVELAESGGIDGVFGALRGESEKLVYPENNIGFSENVALVKKDKNWSYATPRDMQNMHILLIQGYSYGPGIDRFLEVDRTITTTHLHGQDATNKALRMLSAGRADVFFDDRNVLMNKIQEMKLQDQLKIAGQVTPPQPTYIAFSPVTEKRLGLSFKFEQGLQRLKTNGRLDEIFEKYGFRDIPMLRKTGFLMGKPIS